MSHPYPQYPYQYAQSAAGAQFQGWPAPGTASGAAFPAAPAPQAQASWTQGWLAFSDPGYVKGLLLGAGLAYVLTNPTVQRALVKGAVTLWTTVQGGVEEVKEQIQDIKAEMSMKHDAKQE